MTEIDLNGIAALVYRFFLGLDRRDDQAVAALMAKQGVWNRQGEELIGPAAVLAALGTRDTKRRTAHTVANLWAESVNSKTACVHYYLIAYETRLDEAGVESQPRMLGVRQCTDEWVVEDRHWRIARKQSHRILPAGAAPVQAE